MQLLFLCVDYLMVNFQSFTTFTPQVGTSVEDPVLLVTCVNFKGKFHTLFFNSFLFFLYIHGIHLRSCLDGQLS